MRSGRTAIMSILAVWALSPTVALASGGGPLHRSAAQAATKAYNSGLRAVAKAHDYEAEAAKGATRDQQARALAQARQAYGLALEQFQLAVKDKADLFQAWNYIGFTQRHLGDYEAALAAYARALELNPAYEEAIEYRAEAYLGLNRIEDAKSVYMELFRNARPLADQLMDAMHGWISDRQRDPTGLSPEQLSGFAQWVQERAAIAQQTASLATGSAGSAGTATPDWK
jgi:tetratricopeptide (TPR) repeat protein